MKQHTIRYIVNILILSLIFQIAGTLIFKSVPFSCSIVLFTYTILFFLAVTLFSHFLLISITNKNPKMFFSLYLLSTFIRVVIYSIFLVIFVFTLKNGIKCFLVSFILLYLGYTFFEIINISKYFKNKAN
jgi:hypothetical protein